MRRLTASTIVSVALLAACNVPPGEPEVSITPDPAITTDPLVARLDSQAEDPNGDAVTYSYAWSRNGEVVEGLTNAEVPASETAKGELWEVVVTPSDDQEAGDSAMASVVISNAPPVLASATLSTTTPTTSDDLSVTLGETSDPDGDPVTTVTVWQVNGVDVGTGPTLDSARIVRGDTVQALVTPQDGDADGETVASDIATVQNTPPEMTLVTFNPTAPITTDPIVATVSASDADQDAVTYAYTWSINGEVDVSQTASTFPAFGAMKGDVVEVTVTPNDGTDDGAPLTSSAITIQNAVPTAPGLTITPTEPGIGDSMVCTVSTPSTDADSDVLTYVLSWTVDGVAFTGTTSTTTMAGDTVPVSEVLIGQEWKCSATVSDGEATSEVGTSDAVRVALDDIVQFTGESAGDTAGLSVSSAGDVDADGRDDLLVGAPYNDDGSDRAGKVYLFLGKSLKSSSSIDLADADYEFVGEGFLHLAGVSVSSAGDVDGDGKDDLVIGAYYNGDGGTFAGKAYIVLGKSLGSTKSIDLADADYAFVGENAFDYAGYSVSSAGDVDGDGNDDVLVGAYENDDGGSQAGKAYLILGKSLGSSTSIDLADADYEFIGENGGDQAGRSVSSAGDVDGDGNDDILVGALFNDDGGADAGKAYLILGKSLGSTTSIDLEDADYTFEGTPYDNAGRVSSAGDVDGDGKGDLLVGSPRNNVGGDDAGIAHLFLGKSLGSTTSLDLSDADYALVGEDRKDEAGWAVSSAGDVDGDGKDDILVGAIFNDDGGVDAGKAYLVLGKSLGSSTSIDMSLADYAFTGENADDQAGYSVSSAGDVDGDGNADILVGALNNDDGGTDAGAAYLISSAYLGL